MGLKRLYIDIPALIDAETELEKIECEYMFHRNNQGPFSLLEVAEFAAYCRQCSDAFCVAACPKEALELTTPDQRAQRSRHKLIIEEIAG